MRFPFQGRKHRSFTLNHPREREPVSLISAGAIGAEGLYNGRFLPVLILDGSARPDIAELIRVHEFSGTGDVTTQWAEAPHPDEVRLILEFVRPVRLTIILDFALEKWGLLVDQILDMRGFYIQIGTENTRLRDNPFAPKVVCEIPDTGFRKHWEKILTKFTVGLLRKDGHSRAHAKRAAISYINAWREARVSPESMSDFIGADFQSSGPSEGSGG